MSYKDKVIKALGLAKSFDDVDYVINKIQTTDSINRRTQSGRNLTNELLGLAQIKKMELERQGEIPF
jgi:hypothetical protein